MGRVLSILDRLTNVMSGMGTTADKRTAAFYAFVPITPQEAEAAYRSSWLVRKIIDIPPFDMTREWRDWQAQNPIIEKIEAEEKRLQLRAKCQRALILARLYGGGALILGTGDGDTEQELRPDSVKAGGLAYVHVMSRHQLGEGQARTDPEDPWFGHPDFFTINGANGQQVRLHPSRVVAFIGQQPPEGGFFPSASWFWGDPIMQSIGEAVKNADLAQSGFAALIDEAKLDIIHIPELMSHWATDAHEQQLAKRMAAANLGKSTYRALYLDKEEEWEQRQITWAGIPDTMFAFLNVVAGAADIPITRLLGVSPKGLQSTGDGEERDYQAMVRARQEEMLCPALDRVDELLIRSALGAKPDDVYYEFALIAQMSEKDAAEVEKKAAETVKMYADTGLIPDVALSAMAKNRIVEGGRWPGSEAAFEEAAAAGEESGEQDPDELTTLEARVASMEKRGTVTAEQADRLITDAKPRTLYVSRKVVNASEIKSWAEQQGIPDVLPDLHVTIIYSQTPLDWIEAGNASEWGDKTGKLTIAPGGPRAVEPLGDVTAALLFASSELAWRHRAIVEAGASHDYDGFTPHISLTKAEFDPSGVTPYRGKIVLGPEVFEELDEEA